MCVCTSNTKEILVENQNGTTYRTYSTIHSTRLCKSALVLHRHRALEAAGSAHEY